MKSFIDRLKKYSFLLGLILFAIILSRLNPAEIFKNIKEIDLRFLFLASLLLFPILIVKTYCWNYIKRKQGINYRLKDSFLMYCSGIFVGLLTPGRIGEFAKIFYLKQDGYSLGKSAVGIFLDRVSDFAFLLAFIAIGSLLVVARFKQQMLILVLGLIILIALFIILLKAGTIRWFLNKIFQNFIPQKYQKSWQINFQDFIDDLKIYKPKNYLVIAVITIISWCFYYLEVFILAKGIGLEVPFIYFAVSVTIAGLLTLIPVSFYGIGTRDAALLFLFAPFLVPKEQIIVFSNLILAITFLTAFIGLVCWLKKPLKIK